MSKGNDQDDDQSSSWMSSHQHMKLSSSKINAARLDEIKRSTSIEKSLSSKIETSNVNEVELRSRSKFSM